MNHGPMSMRFPCNAFELISKFPKLSLIQGVFTTIPSFKLTCGLNERALVPCSFWQLDSLKHLVFDFEPRGVGGTTPYNFEECSDDIGAMPNLVYADFTATDVTGRLPKGLFRSPKLEFLKVAGIPLGDLPPLDLMPNLKVVEFDNNNVTGPFPSFANMQLLEEVNIQGNAFVPALNDGTRSCFDNCSLLTSIVVSDTAVNDFFSFVGSTRLVSVDLSHNQINASGFPESWSQLTDVVTLDASFNAISRIANTYDFVLLAYDEPSPMRAMLSLKSVDLSHNEIADVIIFEMGLHFMPTVFPLGVQNVDISFNEIYSPEYNLLPEGSSHMGVRLGVGEKAGGLPSLITLGFHHNRLAGFFDLMHMKDCRISVDGSYNRVNGMARPTSHESYCTGSTSSQYAKTHQAMVRVDFSNQATSLPTFITPSIMGDGTENNGYSLDTLLAGANGLRMTPFVPSEIADFQKVEHPKGSGSYPFSCIQWVVRFYTSGTFSIDPIFYEFTGGSTPELRMKWFDPLATSYSVYKERFGGEDGFCKCDLPFVGTPPNCVYACGISNFAKRPGECEQCPSGVSCTSTQQELATLPLLPNHWRVSSMSMDVRRCPTAGACVGGNVAGGYCDVNHEGPYCSVCTAGSAPQDGRCIDCSEIQGNSKALIFVIVIAIAGILVYIAYRRVERVSTFIGKLQTRSMFVKLKQMATFFQIVLLLPAVYLVPYPTDYIIFLNIFSFVNINVVQIFSLGCISGWDFHISFVFACALPLFVATLLAIAAVVYSLIKGHNAAQGKKSRQQAFGLFLLFLWCIFPFICNRTFQMFACETFDDGQELLRADYSIDCTSDNHRSFQIFAGIMIAAYPIGVPCLFFFSMLPYAAELSDIPTRESKFARGKHLSFFSMDYKGEYWYWEIVELGRKLMLNGVLVLCNQGTILQLTVALVVILIHLMVIIQVKPMLHLSNNR
jgi:Leucine-rich repeat (LRR) protein